MTDPVLIDTERYHRKEEDERRALEAAQVAAAECIRSADCDDLGKALFKVREYIDKETEGVMLDALSEDDGDTFLTIFRAVLFRYYVSEETQPRNPRIRRCTCCNGVVVEDE